MSFIESHELDNALENDIDKEQTIDSDKSEFNQDTKGGFLAYQEKNETQHFAKDLVSDIMLPGHASNGKASCGQWKPNGCLESALHKHGGGSIGVGIMTCNGKGCRKCFHSANKKEGRSITNRAITYCSLKRNRKIYLKKNRSRILSHVVVSIPYEEYSFYLTKKGRSKLRTKARTILKHFDIDGGVQIDHAYRFTEGLESARLSPHFHFILTGWIDGGIAKNIYEKTGWIVSNISTMQSWKDCYNLSKYLLSHSAVFLKEPGKRSSEHSVRYFGEWHNKKFKVEEVLKNSVTGFDEISSIMNKRRNMEIKNKRYPLQNVVYTHSVIEDGIKDIQDTFYEDRINGGSNFIDSLKKFITPIKDNPANPQSEPFSFLQMRFDYGHSQYSIVQSVYVNIILDPSLDCLCPECSSKMLTLSPCAGGWSDQQTLQAQLLIADLIEDGETQHIDNISLFSYLKDTCYENIGIPYFDQSGKLQYETGIYSRPDCLDSLNPKLYWNIIKDIDCQKARYQFKLNNGRSPTTQELDEIMEPSKVYATNSIKLTSFMP